MNESDTKNLMPKSEKKCRNNMYPTDDKKREDEEHYWWASDSGSSTGSYYSDTESSMVEWETEIDSMGEVFYIESQVQNLNENKYTCVEVNENARPEFTRRRSTRAGKIMRLIRHKDSKRWNTKNKKSNDIASNNTECREKGGNGNKEVTFEDFQGGEIREVTLWVDPERRHKLGRRATLCEAYFGITPGFFSDKSRVMVAGFIPDGEAMKNKNIKIGDWLRSVNMHNVTLENLDHVLSQISTPTNVSLELQRIAGVDVSSKTQEANNPKHSVLVQQLVNREDDENVMQILSDYPLGILYLKTMELSEAGKELQGVSYIFPRSERKNTRSFLCSAKGAFITLNHLLPGIIGLQPISSTVRIEEEDVHIVYIPQDDELLLIAFPEKCCSLEEAVKISRDIIRVLEFKYQSLPKCFNVADNQASLDHFFILIFCRLLNMKHSSDGSDTSKHNASLQCDIENMENYKFKSTFSVTNYVQLPRDAQIQIDAALSEMEAMDYRDWIEEPMDCQRLYTILGSCIYHKCYLLGSHLAHDDLIDVHSFLRQSGLLNVVNTEPVKNLIVWKKVYPLSCNRGRIETDMQDLPLTPDGKWYLLVVGYGHDLLAVLLESGGCTAKYNDLNGPDVFYVEEAQETLKHIQKIGVTALAAKWIASNARPQVIAYENHAVTKLSSSIAENIFGLIKTTEAPNASIKTNFTASSLSKKSPEVPSILKKRITEENTMTLGSVYSLQTSEDSLSQGTGGISEISDEALPILGRRAIREKINNALRYSDDSDSDIDIYKNDSQVLTMDVSNIRETLLNQAEYLIPEKLTAGDENYLYHYVHLDIVEGIILCSKSIESSVKDNSILINFNKCVHIIHKLLRNAVRFKKMLHQDIDKTGINKSLIAVKEHGVLFEWENTSFWVVGRLYTIPHPKELYVCYQDCAPQNLVEIAFKLY
ncbi:hypothetical protein KM043_004661 [Ampulex compressa]|nr:hypothetical protein KM043_004661 [Ampulex compressa]